MTQMLLYRVAPEGFYAATDEEGELRVLHSDPFETRPGGWEYGRALDERRAVFMAPVVPSKVVGVGRNYREHAAELGNPMPAEPLIFLKAPSSIIGPRMAVVLPPESARVEFEGEIAVVVRQRLRRADAGERASRDPRRHRGLRRHRPRPAEEGRHLRARQGVRHLLPARARHPGRSRSRDVWKSLTRVDGVERQRGQARDMAWGPVELLVYVSRIMTLEPGDVVLTGTPAGVGPLLDGDRLEVEIPGVGVLENPVEAFRSRPARRAAVRKRAAAAPARKKPRR